LAQTDPEAPESSPKKKRPRCLRPPLTLPAEGDGLLNVEQTCAALQIGRSTLWRMVNRGCPRPIRLGRRITRFHISEIRALLQSATTAA
jgi:predicted DNA-binding transcriptional regulator AlpA